MLETQAQPQSSNNIVIGGGGSGGGGNGGGPASLTVKFHYGEKITELLRLEV